MPVLLTLTLIISSLVIIYCGIVAFKKKKSKAALPPGPRGIPIFGNLLQLVKDAPIKFSKWAEQYGSLYTIHFGSKPALVISDAVLMKQLFGMSAATGKYPSDLFDITYKGAYSLVNTEGEIWHEQRVFFVNTLKNIGLSRMTQMEPIILEEIEDVCEWIKTEMYTQGKVHLSERFKTTTGNILWSVAVGEREKTNIGKLMEEWVICLNNATNTGLAFFSWLRYVAPKVSGYAAFVEACSNVHEFVQKYFDDPRRAEGHHHDVISAYMDCVKSTQNRKSSFYGMEGFKHSFSSVVGLLVAGTESTSTNMNWMLFYLSANPDVQDKVQMEIDEVIGEYRDPTLEDRKRMPYTEAVIEETFRMSSLLPFGVIQSLLEDVTFLNYKLPKGLLLIPNLFHVHNDPIVWGDPETFRPERFLTSEGHSSNKDNSNRKNNMRENVVAFQPGKRTCPGESMARDITFIFATKLLKTFRFTPEKGINRKEYMKPKLGYINVTQKLGVVADVRKSEGKD